jgi:protoporphyrin/coproporphyrin ferrochelatase
VVVVPIGFISDHMEVIYDLDVEAKETAERSGCRSPGRARSGRPAVRGDDPRAGARAAEDAPARALGTRGPNHDACPVDCCFTPGTSRRPG